MSISSVVGPNPEEALRGAVRLLSLMDDLPSKATGVLDFGPHGTVLVESGLICWAVAKGMTRRLSDLLRQQRHPPIDRAHLRSVLTYCQENQRPLGETLVERGDISEQGLRTALFQQTQAAIGHLGAAGAELLEFVPHTKASYDPKFSYSAAELLAASGAQTEEILSEAADGHLTAVDAPTKTVFAFVRRVDGGPPTVVAARVGSELGARRMLDVCGWVVNVFDLSTVFDDGTQLITCRWGANTTAVAWRFREMYFVAFCDSRAASSLLTTRLTNKVLRSEGSGS